MKLYTREMRENFHLRFLQILKISWAFFTHHHLMTHTNISL